MVKNFVPYFITGFSDAEGSFHVQIKQNSKFKIGWSVQLIFAIVLHKKDQFLLNNIQKYFKDVGGITKQQEDSIQYIISSIKDLEVIINYFDNFPLITQKYSDYQLFKQAFELIKNKEHLTLDGIQKFVALKASMNKGLSDQLK